MKANVKPFLHSLTLHQGEEGLRVCVGANGQWEKRRLKYEDYD